MHLWAADRVDSTSNMSIGSHSAKIWVTCGTNTWMFLQSHIVTLSNGGGFECFAFVCVIFCLVRGFAMCGIAKQHRNLLIRVWECVGVYVLVFHEAQDLWLFCFLITTAVTSSKQIELATMTSYHFIWQIFIKKLYFLYFYGYNNIILCQAQKNPFKIDIARFLYLIKQQCVLTFSVALDPEVFFSISKNYIILKNAISGF